MAFTAADLESVERAIIELGETGVASASIDGLTVTSKSLAELLKLRSEIKSDLSVQVPNDQPFALGRSYFLKPPGAH